MSPDDPQFTTPPTVTGPPRLDGGRIGYGGLGESLGGLFIEGLIGAGGMGAVYRAFDPSLNRVVAVKVISAGVHADPEWRMRFRREAAIAAAIEHPNVVPVHHVGEEDGRVFMVMRLIDGRSLGEIIRSEGPIEPRRAVRLLLQIAAALEAAHARDVLHRDVTAGNVLIAAEGPDEHAYLTDFGISTRIGELAGRSWAGTPSYLAPEQIRGQRMDARTDIYGFGCVLFAALTGRTPFGHRSLQQTLVGHLTEPSPVPSELVRGIPEPVDAIVARCLGKRPDDRFPDVHALREALAEAVAGTPDPPGPLAQLAAAAAEWAATRDEGLLLRGARLDEWRPRVESLREPARGFVVASARLERRLRIRRRRAFTAAVVAVLVTLASMGLVVRAIKDERRARDEATSRRLARHADAVTVTDPARAVLLARGAIAASPTREAQEALRAAVERRSVLRPIGVHPGVVGAVASADGGIVASASRIGLRLWGRGWGGRRVLRYPSAGDRFDRLLLGIDRAGRRVLLAGPVGRRAGVVRVISTETGRALFVRRLPVAAWSAAVSPNGRWVAAVSPLAPEGWLWEVDSGRTYRISYRATKVTFSGDGARIGLLLAGADASENAWTPLGGVITRLPALIRGQVPTVGNPSIGDVSFAVDSNALAVRNDRLETMVVQVSGGARGVPVGDTGDIYLSPDGRHLAQGFSGRGVVVNDARSGLELAVLPASTSLTGSYGFADEGDAILVRLDQPAGQLARWEWRDTVVERREFPWQVGFNGRSISDVTEADVVVSEAGEVRLRVNGDEAVIPVTGPRRVRYAPHHPSRVAIDGAGRIVAFTGPGRRRLAFAQGAGRSSVVGTSGRWVGLTASADGNVVAGVRRDGAILRWDLREGGPPTTVGRVPRRSISFSSSVHASRDASVVAVADQAGKAWVARPGLPLRRVDTPDGVIAVSRDGRVLAAAAGPEVRFTEVATGHRLATHPADGAVASLTFSENGRLLAVAMPGENRVGVLEWASGVWVARREVPQPVSVGISPHGHWVAAEGLFGSVFRFRCSVCAPLQEVEATARAAVPRDLTAAERKTYDVPAGLLDTP